MNGFFIWNLAMLAFCFFNVITITAMGEDAPMWGRIAVYGGFLVVALICALSYGTGPLSGA